MAQFAAAGKDIKKKSLAEIAMSYGYVYVAQVAMGANPAQTHQGHRARPRPITVPPSSSATAPCEMHSIKGGMSQLPGRDEEGRGVRLLEPVPLQPGRSAQGKNAFTLDSKEPAGGYQEFLMNEARYSRLTREFPERADRAVRAQREGGHGALRSTCSSSRTSTPASKTR